MSRYVHCTAAVSLLILIVGPALVRADDDEELSIDSYRFAWHVIETDGMRFEIQKSESGTRAVISKLIGDALRMAPRDAEEVARVLARTDEFYKKLGRNEQAAPIVAGGVEVKFMRTDETFQVKLAEAQPRALIAHTIFLDRAQAKALAKTMRRTVKMAAFVDEKVRV
jgi:hypothetical protein